MKLLIGIALFCCFSGSVLSLLADDLLSAGKWKEAVGYETLDSGADFDWIDEDIEGDFSRGIVDKTKEKLSKVIKEIPVLRTCKCDEKQCGCCIIFMTKENNVSSCVTIESIVAKEGIQVTLDIGKVKKEVFITEKTHCFDFKTNVVFVCAKPYGTKTNQQGLRSCLQLSLKLRSFKIVSADLDCFRLSNGKFTLEDPEEEERPRKGLLNMIVAKLTKWLKNKDVEPAQ